MIANQVTTKAGKIRVVCQWCDRQSKPLDELDGQPDMWGLNGWSTTPFPAGHSHNDGSTGTRYTCPACQHQRRRNQALGITPLLTPSPERAAVPSRATG